MNIIRCERCRAEIDVTAVEDAIASAYKRIESLLEEVEILRRYGNKDCTAMADEALDAAKKHGDTG